MKMFMINFCFQILMKTCSRIFAQYLGRTKMTGRQCFHSEKYSLIPRIYKSWEILNRTEKYLVLGNYEYRDSGNPKAVKIDDPMKSQIPGNLETRKISNLTIKCNFFNSDCRLTLFLVIENNNPKFRDSTSDPGMETLMKGFDSRIIACSVHLSAPNPGAGQGQDQGSSYQSPTLAKGLF